MSKNNKGKVIQMLSPENYIRKKARTLPIFECLVDSNWEEVKMTTVFVSRNHTNGNITFCTYLVDLLCLGVKDTFYRFNIPVHEYEEFKEKVNSKIEMLEVDYTLAHNIVFAGIEFAEEFGFKPHKDYESITKFMLEEDNEDVELIEIECGIDGQPSYMRGPSDDDEKARKIVAQLEKTAGPGNYSYIDNLDEWEDEDDFDDDDEYSQMGSEEKQELFLDFSARIDDLDEVEKESYVNLTNSIVDDLVDDEQFNQYYDELFEELNIEVDEDEIPDQLLGIKPGGLEVSAKLKNRFINLNNLIGEDTKKANKEVILFQNEEKELPGGHFLELLLLQTEESPKYAKRIKEVASQYPDYAMIQLMWMIEQMTSESNQQNPQEYSFKLKSLFYDRQTIHPIEQFYRLVLYNFIIGSQNDINKIEAFSSVLDELNLSETEQEILKTMNWMHKISCLLYHFNNVMDL